METLVLLFIVGIVVGGTLSVLLRGGKGIFVINIVLGILGAAIGTLLPVLIGTALSLQDPIEVVMLRALLGAFVLVLFASLFRPARLKQLR